MILTLLILILTAGLLYFLSIQKRSLIFYFPIVIVYLEVVRAIVRPLFGALGGFNGIILLTYIYFIILTRVELNRYKKIYSILFVFVTMFIFFFFNAYYDNGLVGGISNVGRFLFIPGIFFIGYVVFNSNYKISVLNKYTYYACILFIVTTVIFTVLDHGKGRGLISGYIQGEIYFFPLFVVLGVIMFVLNRREDVEKFSNSYLMIVLMISLIFSAVSVSRAAWLILIISAFIISIKFFHIKLIRRISFLMYSMLIVLVGFMYTTGLYLERQSKFTDDYEIQEENRVLETIYINELYLTTTRKKLFGTGDGFIPSITFPSGAERVLHSTYNRLFHGYGLMGVFIFLLFNMLILLKLYKAKTYCSEHEIFKVVGYALSVSFLVTTFTGITYPLAYSTLTFLYIGAILGYLHTYHEKIIAFQLSEKLKKIA